MFIQFCFHPPAALNHSVGRSPRRKILGRELEQLKFFCFRVYKGRHVHLEDHGLGAGVRVDISILVQAKHGSHSISSVALWPCASLGASELTTEMVGFIRAATALRSLSKTSAAVLLWRPPISLGKIPSRASFW